MTNDLFNPAYIKLQRCLVCRNHFWFVCMILENMFLLVVLENSIGVLNKFWNALTWFGIFQLCRWCLRPDLWQPHQMGNASSQLVNHSSHLANTSSHLAIIPTSVCNSVRPSSWHKMSEYLIWHTNQNAFWTTASTMEATVFTLCSSTDAKNVLTPGII